MTRDDKVVILRDRRDLYLLFPLLFATLWGVYSIGRSGTYNAAISDVMVGISVVGVIFFGGAMLSVVQRRGRWITGTATELVVYSRTWRRERLRGDLRDVTLTTRPDPLPEYRSMWTAMAKTFRRFDLKPPEFTEIVMRIRGQAGTVYLDVVFDHTAPGLVENFERWKRLVNDHHIDPG